MIKEAAQPVEGPRTEDSKNFRRAMLLAPTGTRPEDLLDVTVRYNAPTGGE